MTKFEELDSLATRQGGIVRTADLDEVGVSRTYFSEYIASRGLERVAHGIYLTPDSWGDSFYILQSRWPQAIFSHEAALYLWGLAEREPMPMTVTVKTTYNTSNLTAEGIKAYKIKQELYELGKSETQTPNGHAVAVYDPERTICDLLRSRSHVEIQDLSGALREYARWKGKNLPQLMRYAKALHVEQVLRPYLEVLLQ